MKNREERRRRVIEKFKTIAKERLERLNLILVELENQPGNDSLAEQLMREIHTLKGESKVVGFADVNFIAHRTEDLIEEAARRRFDLSGGLGDQILRGIDMMSDLIFKTAKSPEGSVDLNAFLKAAERFLSNQSGDSPDQTPSREREVVEQPAVQTESVISGMTSTNVVRLDVAKLDELSMLVGDMLCVRTRIRNRLSLLLGELEQIHQGEDALLRNATGLKKELQDYERDLSSLDEQIRDLRLVPISDLLLTYPRMVRDLAREQNKRIKLNISGGETGVDKQVLDQIADPLLHLLRNAVDHGIEHAEIRKQNNKNEVGEISIQARQVGARVEIVLHDDGAGIDPDRVAEKAVQRGRIASDSAESMNLREKLDLLFEPGFSTRDVVSDVSGRGVGLDVVNKTIQKIGGTVQLESQLGHGTWFMLSVPVSVTITSSLVVALGAGKYAIPSLFVDRIERQPDTNLLPVGGSQGLVSGDEMILFAELSDVIQSPHGVRNGKMDLVILAHDRHVLALRVDAVLGEQKMVMQPLDPFLSGLKLFSGTSMTADADVVLVLAPAVVIQAAYEKRRHRLAEKAAGQAGQAEKTVLVVDDSDVTRDLVVEIVESLGYRVLEATNGLEALSRLREVKADLVLSDVEMPEMTGLELLAELRNQESTSDLPVVMLSTRGSDSDKRKAMSLGADSYIVKSEFQEQVLSDVLTRFLGC